MPVSSAVEDPVLTPWLRDPMRALGLDVADTPRRRVAVDPDPDRQRARRLGADYQPYVIVVDAQGRIVTSLEGRGDEEKWESLAAQLPE